MVQDLKTQLADQVAAMSVHQTMTGSHKVDAHKQCAEENERVKAIERAEKEVEACRDKVYQPAKLVLDRAKEDVSFQTMLSTAISTARSELGLVIEDVWMIEQIEISAYRIELMGDTRQAMTKLHELLSDQVLGLKKLVAEEKENIARRIKAFEEATELGKAERKAAARRHPRARAIRQIVKELFRMS